MASKPTAAIRLGMEGDGEVRQRFDDIGIAGDRAAKRAADAFTRAGEDIDRATQRQEEAARRLAAFAPNVRVGTEQAGPSTSLYRQYQKDMAEQQRQAEALRNAIDPLRVAQASYDRELEVANRLLVSGNITEAEHAQAVDLSTAALRRAGLAQREGAANDNARRFAIQNIGFQLQDFAVQVAGGTSALRAFAQQGPQVAGAMTGFQGKLGAIGAFLNGPWGIALTLATTLAAGFADRLFGGESAGKAAERGYDAAAEGADRLAGALKRLAGANNQQSIASDAMTRISQLRVAISAGEGRGGSTRAGGPERQELADKRAELADLEGQLAAYQSREANAARIKDSNAAAAEARRKAESAHNRDQRANDREAEQAAKRLAKVWEEIDRNGRNFAASLQHLKIEDPAKRANDQAESLYRSLGIDPAQDLRAIVADIDQRGSQAAQAMQLRLEALQPTMEDLRGRAGRLIDTLFRPNGNPLKALLNEVKQEFLELAAINPLKNLLNLNGGSKLPSLGSLLGGVKSLFGGGSSSGGLGTASAIRTGTLGIPGFAGGTDYAPGGLAYVAEEGPELINLPRGASVTPAAKTRQMLSAANDRGGDTHYYDLRGAVVTEQLYAKMAAMADEAAARGAHGGAQLARANDLRRRARAIPR